MVILMQSLAQTTSYLFYFLPAAGSMLLVYGIYQVVVETRQGEHKKIIDRLRGTSNRGAKAKGASSILRKPMGGDVDDNVFSAVFAKLSFMPQIQTLVDQCNLSWSAAKLMTNLSLAGLITVLGLYFLKVNVLIGVGCAAVIVLAPLMVLGSVRKRRMSKLTMQLPDVFEMMSQALRAGHSLASAIQLIHEQMPDPIASEFGQVFHEQNLGIKIEDALLAMADRVDSLDVRFFVTAVLIQRQTGGDLAEVLDKISGVIRQRIELFGLVRGLTAEGRLSGWVLFALPTIIFVAIMYMNPDYANTLLTEPRGKLMLAVAVGMQLVGLAMIRWIVNIKV